MSVAKSLSLLGQVGLVYVGMVIAVSPDAPWNGCDSCWLWGSGFLMFLDKWVVHIIREICEVENCNRDVSGVAEF